MKIKYKIISVILCISLLLSIFVVPSFAASDYNRTYRDYLAISPIDHFSYRSSSGWHTDSSFFNAYNANDNTYLYNFVSSEPAVECNVTTRVENFSIPQGTKIRFNIVVGINGPNIPVIDLGIVGRSDGFKSYRQSVCIGRLTESRYLTDIHYSRFGDFSEEVDKDYFKNKYGYMYFWDYTLDGVYTVTEDRLLLDEIITHIYYQTDQSSTTYDKTYAQYTHTFYFKRFDFTLDFTDCETAPGSDSSDPDMSAIAFPSLPAGVFSNSVPDSTADFKVTDYGNICKNGKFLSNTMLLYGPFSAPSKFLNVLDPVTQSNIYYYKSSEEHNDSAVLSYEIFTSNDFTLGTPRLHYFPGDYLYFDITVYSFPGFNLSIVPSGSYDGVLHADQSNWLMEYCQSLYNTRYTEPPSDGSRYYAPGLKQYAPSLAPNSSVVLQEYHLKGCISFTQETYITFLNLILNYRGHPLTDHLFYISNFHLYESSHHNSDNGKTEARNDLVKSIYDKLSSNPLGQVAIYLADVILAMTSLGRISSAYPSTDTNVVDIPDSEIRSNFPLLR